MNCRFFLHIDKLSHLLVQLLFVALLLDQLEPLLDGYFHNFLGLLVLHRLVAGIYPTVSNPELTFDGAVDLLIM
mgnify:FL=1